MKLNIRGIDTPPDSDPVIISPSTEAQATRRILTPSTAPSGMSDGNRTYPSINQRLQ